MVESRGGGDFIVSTSEHTSLRDISAKRVRVLRQGTEALPVKVSDFGSQFLAAPEEQASRALEQALAHVKPMKAVQALPSQVFYLALKKASPEALVAALGGAMGALS
jgi:hypothetical protein